MAKRILSTYVPDVGREDKLYWEGAKNGIFTIKSAYSLATLEKFLDRVS